MTIEVLPPSNTASEMYEREQMCLENGSREFWVVDLERRRIRVATLHDPARSYGPGEEIPLAAFCGGSLRVDDILTI